MIRLPPISSRTDTLFPYTTLFRSEHIRHRGQPNGYERFHIAGATPIQLAILLCYDEGIAVPGLAVYRHHIGMPRQDNATFYIRAYGDRKSTRLNSSN